MFWSMPVGFFFRLRHPPAEKRINLKQQVRTIEKIIDEANNDTWNERGLNILSPRKVAFQFVSSLSLVLSLRRRASVAVVRWVAG
jgi:hypothetical protein